MKRIITVALLVFATLNFCWAQIPFGIKGGLNVNILSVQNAPPDFGYKTSPSIGFHIGVFTSLKLSDKFSMIPELQYTIKGYSKNEDSVTTEKYSVMLSYVEMPIMFSYRIIKSLGIEVGPSIGLKVGAKSVRDGNSSKLSDDFAETVDIGVQGGVRFNASERISIIGRYNYGLSAFAKYTFSTTPTPGSTETLEFHNSTIQFSVAYKIN
jgi:Outer membrane protein beta-barrel domain